MTTDGVTVRRATASDADEIFRLAEGFGQAFRLRRAVFDENLTRMFSHDDALLLVAGSAPASLDGYLLGFVHPTFFANGPVSWIEEITVSQDTRRRGVGSALVTEFERWARTRRAALVALATRRAAHFYRALGYEESATYLRKLL
jgi:ribosomal protein S18 acetylase RimI-like enzyme